MKRTLLLLIAFAVGAVLNNQVNANDDNYNGWGAGSFYHAQDHAWLNHRAQHRAIQLDRAHYYGISPWRYGRMHSNLNHEAYHDTPRHQQGHVGGAYSPYQYYGRSGLYFRPPGSSFAFSR